MLTLPVSRLFSCLLVTNGLIAVIDGENPSNIVSSAKTGSTEDDGSAASFKHGLYLATAGSSLAVLMSLL